MTFSSFESNALKAQKNLRTPNWQPDGQKFLECGDPSPLWQHALKAQKNLRTPNGQPDGQKFLECGDPSPLWYDGIIITQNYKIL